MERFDKQSLQRLRAQLNVALADIGERNDIVLTIGNIRFSAGQFRVQLEGRTENDYDKIFDIAKVWGLDAKKIGPSGERLVDYNTRGKRYPWIFERQGKRFKTSHAGAMMMFKKDAA